MQRHIKNPVKHPRWRFLQKYPRTFSRNVFFKKIRLRSLAGFLINIKSYWLENSIDTS